MMHAGSLESTRELVEAHAQLRGPMLSKNFQAHHNSIYAQLNTAMYDKQLDQRRNKSKKIHPRVGIYKMKTVTSFVQIYIFLVL